MTTSVQIRNVPEEVVIELKVRAAARRQSLSEYLLDELEEIAATPLLDDFLAERLAQPRRDIGASVADVIADVRRSEFGDA